MDIRNVEDAPQNSIHLFYLHNKYYIMLLNLNRNICVILIVIRMDEGLKRRSFDCVKEVTKSLLIKNVIVAEVMDFCLCEGRKKIVEQKNVYGHQNFLISFSHSLHCLMRQINTAHR